MVTPQTGPSGGVRHRRQVVGGPRQEDRRRRDRARRRQEAPDHHRVPRHPVRLQPGRSGGRRHDQQRQGGHHGGCPARPTPSTRRPTRPRLWRRPSSASSARGRPSSSPGAAASTSPSSGPTATFSASSRSARTWWTSSSKTPTNKKVAFLALNNADGMAWSTPRPGRRPTCEAAGYTIVAPALYTPGAEDFTAQISEFKKEGCEILTGATHHPGLHQLLEAEPAAGLQAPGGEHGPGPRLPAGGGGRRTDRLWTHRARRLMAPHLPLQGLAHRDDLPGAGRRLREDHRQPVDRGDRRPRQDQLGGRRSDARHRSR